MKRLIVIILLLFAGAVVALPGAVGLVTRHQHDRIIAQLNAQGEQLVEERYERGWFSTRTRHRYRIEEEQARKFVASITREPQGTPELLVDSEIFHGPIPAIVGGPGRDMLAWSDAESTLLLRSPSGVETALPGALKSRIEPDGSSRFVYEAGAASRSLENGLTLSWNDADIEVVLNRSMDTASVAGVIGLVRLGDADAAVRIGPTVVTASQQRSRNGLWTGDSELLIDGLSLPGFAADDIVFETRVSESAGQASYAVELNAENLQGEGLTGDPARLDFFAQRVDAQAMGRLLELLSRNPDPMQIPAGQRDALLGRLLAAGPEVTLRQLKIPLRNADIEGDAFVSVEPGTGITLAELSRGARGNATFLLPRSLVGQLRGQATPEIRTAIDMMMRLRVLQPVGNRYRIEAAYANRLLTVNGFPVPVPNF